MKPLTPSHVTDHLAVNVRGKENVCNWLLFGYMFQPDYQITHHLVRTLRQISEVMGSIKAAGLAKSGLERLVLKARSLSAHASTSIEGNPLPLTDVKRLLKSASAKARDTEREVLNYNLALEWLQETIAAEKFDLVH